MGPAGSFESSLPGRNSISIPKLNDDSSNWIDYKTKVLIAMGSRGLMGHVEGRALKPSPYAIVDSVPVLADGSTPATEDQIETRDKRIDEHEMREYLARHIIINSVSLRLAQKIGQLTSSKEMWDTVKADCEGKSMLYQVDVRRRLQDLKCAEGADVKAHLTEMGKLRGDLAAMGAEVKDPDFTAIVIGSLPLSYRPLLSSLVGVSKVTKADLNPNDVIQSVLEEYEHRLIHEHATKADAALVANANRRGKGRKPKQKRDQNVECSNCGRKGHTDKECWRAGGGAEGQGPKQRKKKAATANATDKGGNSKESAATVTTEPANDFFACMATVTSTFEDDDPKALLMDTPKESIEAIIDSGASTHFCADLTKFVNFQPIERSVTAADGRTFKALGIGDVKIDLPNGSGSTRMILKQTLYAPNIRFTLISLSRVIKAGFAVHFEGSQCEIIVSNPTRKVIAKIPESNGLFRLRDNGAREDTANLASAEMTIDELHRKMGHISHKAAEHMVKAHHVDGIRLITELTPQPCDVCIRAKIARTPVPKARSSQQAAKDLGDRIHSDLWGPAQVQALTGELYAITFTDEAKAWSELEGLTTKNLAFKVYKDYEASLLTQFGKPIKEFHSDGGGEFVNEEFNQYLKSKGTKRTITIHNTPEQNGIAERLNRTIFERARAMLIASGLPRFLWLEAARHAVWLKNRTPTQALAGRTPHEEIGRGKPNLSDLHEWGCTVWVKINAGKLDSHAAETRFVGYDKERKGYRVYWPEKRKITVERNVRFVPDTITIPEIIRSEGEQRRLLSVPETSETLPETSETLPETSETPESQSETSRPSAARESDSPEPIRRLPDGLDHPEPGTGRGFRARKAPGDYAKLHRGESINYAESEDPKAHLTIPADDFALALGDQDDPKSVREALAGAEKDQWTKAINDEIRQLDRLRTWELVYPPRGANIINSGFVLHRKRDKEGKIASYKARFVGKGYAQVYGIDYFETFAPSVRMSSQRVVLSYAAREDWEIHQVDIKGAYLNAKLPETIYVKPPQGYLKQGEEGKVCRLLKGLYGVKQAGREWYIELSNTFNELDFTRSETDQCVFYKLGDNPIIVTVSTDDMTLTARYLATINQLKRDLRLRYEIKDLDEIEWLLGVEIKRDRKARTIALSQRAYIESIITEFNLTDAAPLSIPAEPGTILGPHQSPKTAAEREEMANVPYARGVGKLMYYYVATGPQIGFIVRILAQFMANPGRAHWEALKRVIRYLKGVKDHWLILGTSDDGLEGYTDADFASQVDRHSISGYVFRYRGGAVSWSSKKQSVIALSTTEAEYIASTHATQEAVWLRRLIDEIARPPKLPVPIFCDNNGARALAKNDAAYHSRTKHIDIKYHYVREAIRDRKISMIYIPTNENIADILTKALARPKFEPFTTALGVRRLQSVHDSRGSVEGMRVGPRERG